MSEDSMLDKRPGYEGDRGVRSEVTKRLLDEVKSGARTLDSFEDFLTRSSKQVQMFTRELANLDPLTQVPNRRGLKDAQSLLKEGESYGFIIFDIDHFKEFNDKYGHSTGDLMLKTLSYVVLENSREGDTVARWGGEEFAILLPGMNNPEVLEKRAEEIRKMASEIEIPTKDNQILKCTVSVGYGINMNNKTDADTFFDRVDEAVYKAKHGGRNKIVMAQSV